MTIIYNLFIEPAIMDEVVKHILNGLHGINIPEQYGGEDLSIEDILQVVTCISSQDLSAAATLGSHMRVAHYIKFFGRQEQQANFLPRIATGEIIGAHARTEHGSKVKAEKTEEGYVLDGIKPYVTNASEATLFAITASDNADIFLVNESIPNLIVGHEIPRIGILGTSLCSVYVNGCLVSADAILGENEGRGREYLKETKRLALMNYMARARGALQALQVIAEAAPPDAISDRNELTRRIQVRITNVNKLIRKSVEAYNKPNPIILSQLPTMRSRCVALCINTLFEMMCSYTYTNPTFAKFYRDIPSLAIIGGRRK